MLKPQNLNKFKNFKFEELIFSEDNEIKVFFKHFFEKFEKNKVDNGLDLSHENFRKEKIHAQKEEDQYSLKFNENIAGALRGDIVHRRRVRYNSVIQL